MIDNMHNQLRRTGPGGFTLIETLVAVLMLTLTIAGPLTIASKGQTATLVAKDQFIAFYLAQDALEYVRFLRDGACLAATSDATGCPSAAWMAPLNNCLTSVSTNGCTLSSLGSHPDAPAACGASACVAMNFDTTNKVYNYNGAMPVAPQKFVRTVKIDAGSIADEAVVTITVSWSTIAGVTPAPVTIRENLLRWQ